MGYAFVDLSTPTEAERAIAELSGKEILERKVSVQLARKPESAAEKTEGVNGEGSGAEGSRRRASGRGRGRGRGRGGRGTRGGRAGVSIIRSLVLTHLCLVWTNTYLSLIPLFKNHRMLARTRRTANMSLLLPPRPQLSLPMPRATLRFNH